MIHLRLPIEAVIVPDARQRKGLGVDTKKAQQAFEELKGSIKARGLINPIRIVSETDPTLQAGYRRLMACKALGMAEVDCTTENAEQTELERELLELDENIQRLDLEWHEREMALARIDKLRTKLDPSWTQQKTADLVGTSQSKISEAVSLTKMMELFPEIKKAESRTAAMSQAKAKAKTTLRKVEVKSNPEMYKSAAERVLCADSSVYIQSMPDGSAGRLILTDPPFGINYDKRPAADGAHEAYSDSPEDYRKMVSVMAPHLYRVLPDDGWLVWFLASDHLDWCRSLFGSVGFAIDPVPLVWDRSDGRTYSVRPDRWFGKAYDIALHGIKGQPEMVNRNRKGGNVFRFKPIASADKDHIVERPPELYEEIIKCLTVPGEKVTDFFGGSGSVAAGAALCGREHFTVEKDPNHIPTIVQKIFNFTPTPKLVGGGAKQ